MAFSMKSSIVCTPVAQQVRPRAASRAVVPVAASAEETSRRALLGGIFAAGAALIAGSADAKVVVASQFSYGGLGAATGKPGNSSQASMESYNMEGTKKKGISPKRKAKVLDRVKAEAAATSASAKEPAKKK